MEIIDIDRLIEMCWEDRTPFEAIEYQFGLKEEDAIKIMRNNLKPKSFKVWRKKSFWKKKQNIWNLKIQLDLNLLNKRKF